MMNSMLISSITLYNFWVKAFLTACILQNRIPHKKIGKLPMSCGEIVTLILNTWECGGA